jgi:hypothetical protein
MITTVATNRETINIIRTKIRRGVAQSALRTVVNVVYVWHVAAVFAT